MDIGVSFLSPTVEQLSRAKKQHVERLSGSPFTSIKKTTFNLATAGLQLSQSSCWQLILMEKQGRKVRKLVPTSKQMPVRERVVEEKSIPQDLHGWHVV